MGRTCKPLNISSGARSTRILIPRTPGQAPARRDRHDPSIVLPTVPGASRWGTHAGLEQVHLDAALLDAEGSDVDDRAAVFLLFDRAQDVCERF